MTIKNNFLVICAVLFMSLFLITGISAALNTDETTERSVTTLDNLLTAYNGESNAQQKYLDFAKKADEEGYGKIASLFRAAAQAEQVHLERHAKIIKKLGGTPVAVIAPTEVRSTKENLENAFDGETYENTKMYPEFLSQAKIEKVTDAIDAFEDAAASEKVHAQLYAGALKEMGSWKTKTDFYVCPVCGNVVEKLPGQFCPICMAETYKFVTVN